MSNRSSEPFTMATDINKDPNSTLNLEQALHVSRGHSGRVVILLPPTSEARVRFPAQSQVGKLVLACYWLAVYSEEP